MPAAAVQQQVGDSFADRRRELEAVTRARAHDQYLLVSWMRIDQEMAIRRVRVETDAALQRRVRGAGYEPVNQPLHDIDFGGAHCPIHVIRLYDCSLMMQRRLETVAGVGHRVDETILLVFPDRDRTRLAG